MRSNTNVPDSVAVVLRKAVRRLRMDHATIVAGESVRGCAERVSSTAVYKSGRKEPHTIGRVGSLVKAHQARPMHRNDLFDPLS